MSLLANSEPSKNNANLPEDEFEAIFEKVLAVLPAGNDKIVFCNEGIYGISLGKTIPLTRRKSVRYFVGKGLLWAFTDVKGVHIKRFGMADILLRNSVDSTARKIGRYGLEGEMVIRGEGFLLPIPSLFGLDSLVSINNDASLTRILLRFSVSSGMSSTLELCQRENKLEWYIGMNSFGEEWGASIEALPLATFAKSPHKALK